MVRLLALTCALLAAAPQAQARQNPFAMATNAARSVVKAVLTPIFGEEQATRLMKSGEVRPPDHPYALDLNDTNWETVIRTGTYSSLAPPLPEDTVWFIQVYGPDLASRQATKAFDEVALTNSSEGGGSLPANYRFARINYNTETILPTRWWMWKPPMLVIATNNLRTLRFFSPRQLPPFAEATSKFIAAQDFWESLDPWSSKLAPGGSLEPVVIKVANAWAWWHSYISQVPHFVLLMFGGFVANYVVAWFHDPAAKAKAKAAAEEKERAEAAKLHKAKMDALPKDPAEKKQREEALLEDKAAEKAADSGEDSSAAATGVRRGGARAAKRK